MITVREHRREDMITKVAPVAYDPDAKCPRWLAFLDRVFDGNDELIAFVQRAVGYSLTGHTIERCMFICHGNGANGKTTLLETLLAILGDYAAKTPAETLMLKRGDSIPNDVARLQGVRFVVASETRSGARLDEGRIKELTGGDTVPARFLHAEWFEFKPQFKIWLATNHKPVIVGTDDAIWSRIRLVPFDVTIPKNEQDKNLTAKLVAEGSGIMNWALAGLERWQEDGLGDPPAVVKATDEYRAEQDVIGRFIEERCVMGKLFGSGATPLYADYKQWCEQNGERAVSQKEFGTDLGRRGLISDRDGTTRRKVWKGIGMLTAKPS